VSDYGVCPFLSKFSTPLAKPKNPFLVSYNLERYYRHRREISRLYQPIDTGPEDSSSESGEDPPTYLPMYNVPQKGKATPMRESSRLGDVWDTREDVFSLGEEDEDEDVPQDKKSSSGATPKVVR
jgi:hypothetical protein